MNYCVPLATTRKLTELFLLRVVLRVDSKISLVPHMDIIESVTNFKFRVDSSRELLLVWISLERKWKFVCTRKKLTMLGSISNVSILQSPNKTNLNAIYVVHVASLFCLVYDGLFQTFGVSTERFWSYHRQTFLQGISKNYCIVLRYKFMSSFMSCYAHISICFPFASRLLLSTVCSSETHSEVLLTRCQPRHASRFFSYIHPFPRAMGDMRLLCHKN